jgi:hypothetical protein
LLAVPFYLTLLPFSGHDSYFLLSIVQNCPFQFHLDWWMKFQLELLSSEHFQL